MLTWLSIITGYMGPQSPCYNIGDSYDTGVVVVITAGQQLRRSIMLSTSPCCALWQLRDGAAVGNTTRSSTARGLMPRYVVYEYTIGDPALCLAACRTMSCRLILKCDMAWYVTITCYGVEYSDSTRQRIRVANESCTKSAHQAFINCCGWWSHCARSCAHRLREPVVISPPPLLNVDTKTL
jgi:hypothetical protein